MALGNPYVVDRPVTEGDPYVPRYKLQARVVQWLRRERRFILVYGPARMGKTTFLQHLIPELSPEFSVVRVDFRWPEGGDAITATRELQAMVSTSINAMLEQPLQDVGTPYTGLTPMPDALQDRRVVVLVDGLSVTDLHHQAGIEFMRGWQEWLNSMPRVAFVVTVNGRPEGAVLSNTALASIPSIEIEGFTVEETEELLLRPIRDRMTYNFDAVHRIWQLTSGHPYFVQLFGHALFLAHSGRGRVEIHDVDKAVQDVITASHPVMSGIWQACSAQAQVLLVISNELRGRHGVFTVRELQGAAQLQGLELSLPTIEAGLSELLAGGVLRRLNPDSYSLYAGVFRPWLARYKPLSQALNSWQDQKQMSSFHRSPRWGSLRWSTIGTWLTGLALLTAMIMLWRMRGSPQRLFMGLSATATPLVPATRATLVIGPALGRIAYMAKDKPDATWDIWVMRADGLDPKRLTDDPANDMSPSWSPDGKYIAFVSDRDGNKEIYVMKADGTQQLNLTHNPSDDATPAWSPDGSRIAFSSYRDGNWEIYVMPAPTSGSVDTSSPQRLTRNNAPDLAPSWSPDSKRIAFTSNRDGNWNIYVMNYDGTGLQRLTADEATDSAPAWSPDGTTIAFESYRDGDMEIYLMAADGADQLDFSEDHYSNEHGPAWARNGTKLLYYSNRDGGWDIYTMKPDGTEKNNLTLSPALEQSPAWHE